MASYLSLRGFFSVTLSVFVGIVLFIAPALPAEATVTTESEFNNALSNLDIDTIIVTGGERGLIGTLAIPVRPYALTGVVDDTGAPASIITGASGLRILNVSVNNPNNPNGSLTSISNLILRHLSGSAGFNGSGGAVYVAGDITDGIHNSEFRNHTIIQTTTTPSQGSAIYVRGNFSGDLSNTVFDNNHASGVGALYIAGSFTGNVIDTTFSNNVSENTNSGYGGAGLVVNGTFTGNIEDSFFSYNNASANAGGAVTIYGTGDTFNGNITNSQFIGNTNLGTNANARIAGAVYIRGNLNGGIDECLFQDNAVDTGHGGGIYVGSSIRDGIMSSTFINNSANWGGGIAVMGTLNGGISESTFEGNVATSQGGAVYAAGGITGGITESRFIGNTSENSGGAIITAGLTDGISESLFQENETAGSGGAIAIASDSTFTGGISESDFIENAAGGSGGAIVFSTGSTFTGGISESNFTGNAAGGSGGAIFFSSDSTFTGDISMSDFIGNEAVGSGGAIAIASDSTFTGDISMSDFIGNEAGGSGGAIAIASNSTFTGDISESNFIENKATSYGAAIYFYNSTGDIVDSTFEGNETQATGTVYVATTFVGDIIRTTFADNTAANVATGGAGLVVMGGMTGSIVESVFSNNVGGSMIGGAVSLYTGNLVGIVDSTFSDNRLGASVSSTGTPSRGGAVAVYGYNNTGGSITNGISESIFSGNGIVGTLSEGGAVWARSIAGGITNSRFTDNYAQKGGAIFVTNGISGDIAGTSFDGNTATADGGALYIQSGALSLVNPVFQGNTAETGHGGAIYTTDTVAIAVDDGGTGLFTGNTASGSANAIWFSGSGGLSADVADGGLLDMRDALGGESATGEEIAITKTGEGTWALGGATAFAETGGATTFSVLAGTLHLYGAGEVANATTADGGAMVEAATINLAGADSFFVLGDGGAAATLVVGGDNAIHADGGIFLNDQAVVKAGDAAATSLVLSTASDPVLVNGTAEFAVESGDRSLTIDALFVDQTAGGGMLEKTGEGSLILAQADAMRDVARFAITAGTVQSEWNQSFANLASAAGTSLVLDGADLTISEGELRGTTSARNLTKTDSGLLQVNSAVQLQGELSVLGGTLGVFIDNVSPTIVADSVSFASGTNLVVTGYSGSGELAETVIIQAAQAISDEDMPSWWSLDNWMSIPYNFIYGGITRGEDGASIVVAQGLYWYHEGFDSEMMLYTEAHGLFTVDAGDSFLLDASLNDREYGSHTGWDGKSLLKDGGGVLELLAASSYTGGTTVAEGTLIASAEDALGSGGAEIQAGASLVFNHDGVILNALTGSGSVETRGELIFDADMTGHDGDVLVAAGSLGLGQATSSPFVSGAAFTVSNGTVLYGNGEIGGLLVESGGVVSPGYSIGSVQIDGDLVFEEGSFFDVELASEGSDADTLSVTGTADLGGAVVRHIGTGSESDYPTVGEWTILTADGGLNGTRFADEVLGNYLFLEETLVYPDDNTVLLLIERNSREFTEFAETPNQMQVTRAIDSLPGGDLQDALLAQSEDTDMSDLFDQLSGELHSSVRGMLQSADRAFGQAILHRGSLPTKACQEGIPTWIEIGGFDSRGTGGQGVAGARHTGLNFTLGVEKCFAGEWLIGGAFRYGDSRTRVEDRHSKAEIDSYAFGLYGSRTLEVGPGTFRLSIGASYGLHDVDARRSLSIASDVWQRLESDYRAHTAQALGDLAYAFAVGDVWEIGPFAQGAWNSLWSDSFTERGGNAALRAQREHQGNFSHLAGARATVGMGDRFGADVEAGWLHTYGDTRTTTGFTFVEGGDRFTIHGVSVPRDAVQVRAGVTYAVNSRVAMRVGYEAVMGKNLRSHFGNLSLECAF